MTQEQMEKLLDAFVLAETGWSGDLHGPMHQAHLEGRRIIQERKAEIMKLKGICPSCGCDK